MKIRIALLLVNTANLVVCSTWDKISFPPEILQPDIEAIENYFNNINNNIDAFVHWPNNISFVAYCDSNSGNFIKILGTFSVSSEGCLRKTTSYDGLYFKGGQFYVMSPKKTTLVPISAEIPVSYSQPELKSRTTYLSIRYFGLEEIVKMVEPFSTKHYWYLWEDHPLSLYLATTPNFHHFIEYNVYSASKQTCRADGKLRVLIGREKDPENLILSESIEAYKLELNLVGKSSKRHDYFTIPTELSEKRETLQNVFGVRMATKGVLTEVQGPRIRMFNSVDLSSRQPTRHVIPIGNFMAKIREAEPQHLIVVVGFNYADRPQSTYVQVLGHVLEKRVNFVDGKEDEDCPVIIEYANKDDNRYFWYGNDRVEKLCTDDSTAWATTTDGKTVRSLDVDITLTYPEY